MDTLYNIEFDVISEESTFQLENWDLGLKIFSKKITKFNSKILVFNYQIFLSQNCEIDH